MPSKKATQKPRMTKAKTRSSSKKDGAAADFEAEAVVEQKPLLAMTYETFETTTPLAEGLCIVRKLADGRFELLNLTSADAGVLGSLEAGQDIRADQTGARLNALEEVEVTWKDVEFKVRQALDSAKLGIFYFLRLPVELRYMIYELTMRSKYAIRVQEYRSIYTLSGLRFSETCRQVYEESRSMFWRNNVRFNGCSTYIRNVLLPSITGNLQTVTWRWTSSKIKDPQTLRIFKLCKNLRTLHIEVSQFCSYRTYVSKTQRTYQDEPSAKRLRKCYGYDTLLELRGLDLVTVSAPGFENWTSHPYQAAFKFSEKQFLAFQEFLNKILTQPEPELSARKTRSKRAKRLIQA